MGITQQRVSQITSGIQATTEPKLLNHGGKREGQGSYTHVARGETKDYITARLKRDGQEDLAGQVEKGELSARQAGIKAGFVGGRVHDQGRPLARALRRKSRFPR